MPPAASPADVAALAGRLRPVLLHINRHMRREVHAMGLSNGQVSALATIRDNPGIGVGDLAARERMSAPSMSVHIDRLERAGLVNRQRDADDKRRVGLTITPEGDKALRSVRTVRTQWLASRLERLDDKERAAIDEAIDALSALVAAL